MLAFLSNAQTFALQLAGGLALLFILYGAMIKLVKSGPVALIVSLMIGVVALFVINNYQSAPAVAQTVWEEVSTGGTPAQEVGG